MKRFLIVLLCAVLLYPLSVHAKKPVRITVLSYNVQAAKRFPTEEYAKFIKQYNPDFVAFQELDYMTKRYPQKADFLDEVAKQTGMHPVYAASMAYSEGQYGIGLMTRFPLLGVQAFALPQPEGSYEPRRAVSAVAQVNKDLSMRFTSTHLDLPSDAIRTEQVTSLTKWLSGDDMPSIVCGDFNATPETNAIKYMKSHWQQVCDDQTTYPEKDPRKKIDYIFVKGHGTWKVVDYKRLVDIPLSDHCPILVTLEYTEQ